MAKGLKYKLAGEVEPSKKVVSYKRAKKYAEALAEAAVEAALEDCIEPDTSATVEPEEETEKEIHNFLLVNLETGEPTAFGTVLTENEIKDILEFASNEKGENND